MEPRHTHILFSTKTLLRSVYVDRWRGFTPIVLFMPIAIKPTDRAFPDAQNYPDAFLHCCKPLFKINVGEGPQQLLEYHPFILFAVSSIVTTASPVFCQSDR